MSLICCFVLDEMWTSTSFISSVPKIAGKNTTKLPGSNTNSTEWYMKNVTVAGILDQINQIDQTCVSQVARALRGCLETFTGDLRRIESNIAKAVTPSDLLAVVRPFQSVFRFHLLNRVANVVSRVKAEEGRRDSTEQGTAGSKNPAVGVTATVEPKSLPKPKPQMAPARTKNAEAVTIDLTDDDPPLPPAKRRRTSSSSSVSTKSSVTSHSSSVSKGRPSGGKVGKRKSRQSEVPDIPRNGISSIANAAFSKYVILTNAFRRLLCWFYYFVFVFR